MSHPNTVPPPPRPSQTTTLSPPEPRYAVQAESNRILRPVRTDIHLLATCGTHGSGSGEGVSMRRDGSQTARRCEGHPRYTGESQAGRWSPADEYCTMPGITLTGADLVGHGLERGSPRCCLWREKGVLSLAPSSPLRQKKTYNLTPHSPPYCEYMRAAQHSRKVSSDLESGPVTSFPLDSSLLVTLPALATPPTSRAADVSRFR